MSSNTPDLKLASGFDTPTFEHWRALVEKALKGTDFDRRLVSRTSDGLTVNPLYTRNDALVSTQGELPGAAPYTRGRTVVRDGLGWSICAMHAEQDPEAANMAILEDLEGGVNLIALQIGGIGLPTTREALEVALKDVMLDACPIALIAGEQTFEAAASLNALWASRGLSSDNRRGSYGADPIGTLARQGSLAETTETALARAVALVTTALPMPHVAALSSSGVGYHNAGASEAQELAAMLATLVAYLRACEKGGIKPADALGKISVALAADADQFATIAKLRAGRKLVWRVAEACGGGTVVERVRFACPTSYRMMARRDPWTNILRTTIACAGAALGGADSICVLPFTFALGKPDAFTRRVARNIQIVCQEESNLGRVNDPAGGSWYVEQLTDELAKKAWELFQDIEARGGMIAGLMSGYVQESIARTAEARLQQIATGRIALTGISAFPLLGDDGIKAEPWPKPAPSAARRAEIEVTPLTPCRLGEPFEDLRDYADAKGGSKIFLASMGEIVDHNIRSTWAKNYLAAGGIAALTSDGYKTSQEAAAAFKASGIKVACICSSDAVYATLAENTARALKSAGAAYVLLAGHPGDREAALKSAGVDQFLSAGANAIEILKGLHDNLG